MPGQPLIARGTHALAGVAVLMALMLGVAVARPDAHKGGRAGAGRSGGAA